MTNPGESNKLDEKSYILDAKKNFEDVSKIIYNIQKIKKILQFFKFYYAEKI